MTKLLLSAFVFAATTSFVFANNEPVPEANNPMQQPQEGEQTNPEQK